MPPPAGARSRARPSSSRNVTTQSAHADVACITHASHEMVNGVTSSIGLSALLLLMTRIMNEGCLSAIGATRSMHQRQQLLTTHRVGTHRPHVADDLLIIGHHDNLSRRRQSPNFVADHVVGDHVPGREHDAYDATTVGD